MILVFDLHDLTKIEPVIKPILMQKRLDYK